MENRPLGQTGIELSPLSFGASSLGAEFRKIDIPEALRAVHVAIDSGMNFIDTSPYYGRGMSEVLLGLVLPDLPRDAYYLGTKLGRYSPEHFDFSARRVCESVEVSLQRMKVLVAAATVCSARSAARQQRHCSRLRARLGRASLRSSRRAR